MDLPGLALRELGIPQKKKVAQQKPTAVLCRGRERSRALPAGRRAFPSAVARWGWRWTLGTSIPAGVGWDLREVTFPGVRDKLEREGLLEPRDCRREESAVFPVLLRKRGRKEGREERGKGGRKEHGKERRKQGRK